MMPQMKGHHQFVPKDASTLLMQEESPSFFNQKGDEDRSAAGGVTNNRITDMIFRQDRAPFDSNLDESRPLEMPSMQIQSSNQSILPGIDQSAVSHVKPTPDNSFAREVQNLNLSYANNNKLFNYENPYPGDL